MKKWWVIYFIRVLWLDVCCWLCNTGVGVHIIIIIKSIVLNIHVVFCSYKFQYDAIVLGMHEVCLHSSAEESYIYDHSFCLFCFTFYVILCFWHNHWGFVLPNAFVSFVGDPDCLLFVYIVFECLSCVYFSTTLISYYFVRVDINKELWSSVFIICLLLLF